MPRQPNRWGLWVGGAAVVFLAAVGGAAAWNQWGPDDQRAVDETEEATETQEVEDEPPQTEEESPAEPEPVDDEPEIDADALAQQICDDLTNHPTQSPLERASFILRGEGVEGADLVIIRNDAEVTCPDAFEFEETVELTPDDLALEVVVLEKQCFGSAGCRIGFRVELTYLGAEGPDPDSEYEVTYEVQGGESTYINTLTTEGRQYLVEERERISTESEEDELTAVVTRVTER